MGHYCRICRRQQPNEQFSGKGHKIHVSKRCKAMPKSERQVIENLDDIFRLLIGFRIGRSSAQNPAEGRTDGASARSPA
jgi:hypothetical protein